MIYGAYGYTGELIARHAVVRGHRPLLAGRNPGPLARVARALDLPFRAFGLDDRAALRAELAACELVLHAAGPFVRTSQAMVDACLDTGVHYLDITGELKVLAGTLARDAEARERGVSLVSGAGFDVVPGDCLLRSVAEQAPTAKQLILALAANFRPSGGTASSAFDVLMDGGARLRDGRVVAEPLASEVRTIRFSDRERVVATLPFGDLATAPRTTGIANLTTYLAMPRYQAYALRRGAPLALPLFRQKPVRELAMTALGWVKGGDEGVRRRGRAHFFAEASSSSGVFRGWLDTPDPYDFTQAIAVRAVERVLASPTSGALTPAVAFGADFALEVRGVQRHLGALP